MNNDICYYESGMFYAFTELAQSNKRSFRRSFKEL